MITEYLRRWLRSLIGYSSWPYAVSSRLLASVSVIRAEGRAALTQMVAIRNAPCKENAAQPLRLKKLAHPIHVRSGSADVDTVIDNVVREEYGKFRKPNRPLWMIDAGAYIGDTSAYFLSRFSELEVIALEPNPPSHTMAKLNLAPYGGRAHLLQKGLSATDQVLYFGGDSTGAGFRETGLSVECTCIKSLMREYEIPYLDILKMDIEGAEVAIFESDPEEWLDRVNLLQIELHGHRAEKLIPEVLKKNGFKMRQYRSVWYCSKAS